MLEVEVEVEELELSEESVPVRGGAAKTCCVCVDICVEVCGEVEVGRDSTSVREEVDVFAVVVWVEEGMFIVFCLV